MSPAARTSTTTPPQSLKVLELGCGHGLPGILCLLAGAEVHFQDYNAQVPTGTPSRILADGMTAASNVLVRGQSTRQMHNTSSTIPQAPATLPGVPLSVVTAAPIDTPPQVLTSLTAPNVAANLAKLPFGAVRQQTRYFAGEARVVLGHEAKEFPTAPQVDTFLA